MASYKKRINLSVSDETHETLRKLARRDAVPLARKALELLIQALSIEEDIILEKLASGRDQKKARYISHEAAWK